jgi:hypothetical protein
MVLSLDLNVTLRAAVRVRSPVRWPAGDDIPKQASMMVALMTRLPMSFHLVRQAWKAVPVEYYTLLSTHR